MYNLYVDSDSVMPVAQARGVTKASGRSADEAIPRTSFMSAPTEGHCTVMPFVVIRNNVSYYTFKPKGSELHGIGLVAPVTLASVVTLPEYPSINAFADRLDRLPFRFFLPSMCIEETLLASCKAEYPWLDEFEGFEFKGLMTDNTNVVDSKVVYAAFELDVSDQEALNLGEHEALDLLGFASGHSLRNATKTPISRWTQLYLNHF